MARIAKHSVLILDDFGLEKLSDISRMGLLEIIEEFHRRKSVIIVAQIPVSLWHETIGEPTIADAIMDRVVLFHRNRHLIWSRIYSKFHLHPLGEYRFIAKSLGCNLRGCF